MSAATKKRSSALQCLLIFAIVYLGSQMIINQFFPQTNDANVGVELSASSSFVQSWS